MTSDFGWLDSDPRESASVEVPCPLENASDESKAAFRAELAAYKDASARAWESARGFMVGGTEEAT